MPDKKWEKLDVGFVETPSPDEAGRTDISFGYEVADEGYTRPAHYVTVGYNRVDADGVVGVRAAWKGAVDRMVKHGIPVQVSGRTTLKDVISANVFRVYRFLFEALGTLIAWGEKNSKQQGRSVPKETFKH